jgi:site-specific DNA-methyltransferase (adenine-specific)
MKQNTVQQEGQKNPYLNSISQGDCVSLLAAMPAESVDFALTDPPYLVRYVSRDGRRVPNDNNDRWLQPAFAGLYRVLRRDSYAVSFYGWSHADRFLAAYRAAGFSVIGHLVFAKHYASSANFVRYKHEQAYLLAKGSPEKPADPISDVIEWTYTGNKLHPTQKPIPALLKLVAAFSKPGQIVIDPFCGSGSSLVAARMLGRNFIGFDLDVRYAAIAARRLRSDPLN